MVRFVETAVASGRAVGEASGPLAVFAARMRACQREAGGPSVRELEFAMRRAGCPFSRSTINDKLGGVSKPSWEFVEAFVTTCATFGPGPARPIAIDEWRRAFQELLIALARRRLAGRDPVISGDAASTQVGARVAVDPGDVAEASTEVPAVPRQLPPVMAGFTGRDAESARIAGLLTPNAESTPLVVIAGMAGVGKTTLAVRAAHRAAHAYPDGQLYLDLHGYHPGEPIDVARALTTLCRALGATDVDPDADLDELAARWRSVTAGRRLLLVLDNVRDDAQALPLLPGDPAGGAVLTSRDSLARTVVAHGATRVDLAPLSPAEAHRLLIELIGPRAAADPVSVARLGDRCGRLPLALRIAAEIVASRPDATVASICADLGDEAKRLDFFDLDETGHISVRPVLSWSYRQLPPPAARLFQLFGAYPGVDIEVVGAAALAGVEAPTAQRLLDTLTRAHMMHRVGGGRYGCHDLLRAYAKELAADRESSDDAVARVLRHMLAGATGAMDTAYPAERHRRPVPAPTDAEPIGFADARAARGWLDDQVVTIVALAGSPRLADQGAAVLRLAAVVWRHFDVRGYYAEANDLHTAALEIAIRMGDRRAEAFERQRLGFALMRVGRLTDALHEITVSLNIWRASDDQLGVASCQSALGLVYEQQGRLAEAAPPLRAALAAARSAGERFGEAAILGNLSRVLSARGDTEEAIELITEAIAIYQDLGDAPGRALMHNTLGATLFLRGQDDQAYANFLAAQRICSEIGDRRGMAWALQCGANVRRRRGEFAEALDQYDLALAIFAECDDVMGVTDVEDSIGDAWQTQREYALALGYHQRARAAAEAFGGRRLHASALNGIGEDLAALGNYDEARTAHQEASRIAAGIAETFQHARALRGLARVSGATARPNEAIRLSRDAYALFASMGAIEATHLAEEIAALEG